MLSRFRDPQLLHSGSKTLVWRAVRLEDGGRVVLKAARSPYPSPAERARLRHEHEILRRLDVAGVVRSLGIVPGDRGPILVLHDAGGDALRNHLDPQGMPIARFLELAPAIARVLAGVHRAHVIHKDLHPGNILLLPGASPAIELIDFGLASPLSREQPEIQAGGLLEGTPGYLSPEQTGRMNRAIDWRSDLYSLGATFYEMLTGRLPFQGGDTMEIVHALIARLPPPPHEVRPEVPATLSAIVMKLLAKTANERYQSAFGLSHDLDRVKEAVPFELASRDVAERFHVPDRLYGREREVERLLGSFDRAAAGAAEVLLVTGQAGIGKSSLVNEVRRAIAHRRGYFIEGKFDQFQRDIPYASILHALGGLARQLITESEARIRRWRERLVAALGPNASLATVAVRELEILVGPQPPAPYLPPEESRNRADFVFQSLIRVFASDEHPLVVFLDDLQWADLASLDLLKRLMASPDTHHLLVIAAYRDQEVGPAHAVTRMIDSMRATSVAVHEVAVGPLDAEHVRGLVADAVHRGAGECAPLADLIFARTRGNPFFVREFLASLYEAGRIRVDPGTGAWTWDLDTIRSAEVSETVGELMTERIERLPEETRRVLEIAACIGNRFELATLSRACSSAAATTARLLLPALEAGLCLPLGSAFRVVHGSGGGDGGDVFEEAASFRFVHDRVQQAARERIPPASRVALHLRIGRILLDTLPEQEQEARLFEIVQHLNQGLDRVTDPVERERFARLDLAAGTRAKQAAAFHPAASLLRAGRSLLRPDAWDTQYALALSLHCEGVEAAGLTSDFVEMDALAAQVLARARTALDRMPVYEARISTFASQMQPGEALSASREALRLLGVDLPAQPSLLDVGYGLARTKLLLRGKGPADLSRLPELQLPEMRAAMRVLMETAFPAYTASPNMFPLIVFEMIRISVRHGNCPQSAFGYIIYAILSSALGDIAGADALGRFALELVNRFHAPELTAKILISFYSALEAWTRHARDTLEPLMAAYHRGLEIGDTEYAVSGPMYYGNYAVFVGEPLGVLERRLAELVQVIRQHKQDFAATYTSIYHQLVQNLVGLVEAPTRLSGAAFDEGEALGRLADAKNLTALFNAYLCKAMLCYLLGDPRQAAEHARQAKKYEEAVLGTLSVAANVLYQSLALLAAWGSLSGAGRIQARVTLIQNRRRLRAWAEHAPMNFAHKLDLVDAEQARVEGRAAEALLLYERAIAGARSAGYVQEAALAAELAARHQLALGLERAAQRYLVDAWQGFASWGATAKVRALEAEFGEALAQAVAVGADRGGGHSASKLATVTTRESTASHASQSLDLATVFSASRAIAEEIVLDTLLRKLIRLLIQNAGAERGLLLLEEGGELAIAIESAVGDADIDPGPARVADLDDRLSVAILNYVRRTADSVVLGDAARDGLFQTDPYVAKHRPRSVLCAPLSNQGKVVAVIYLENNLIAGAFTAERLEVLRILLAQAALSLHNARLYANLEVSKERLEEYSRTLEHKVETRTSELRDKNEELRATLGQLQEMQRQLVTQEKLASLGALTAGVAHELKNPLNFVNNFAELAVGLVEEVAAGVSSLDAAPDSVAGIQDALGDLQQNVTRIKEHGRRANGIIDGMLLHARSSAGVREPAALNAVVAESLDRAYHALRGKDGAVDARVSTDYDDAVGDVEMVASEIGRVFINILDNAFYAMREKQRTLGATYTPALHLRTQRCGDRVEVRVRDNGTGIPADVVGKIFNPFFTTKPAGLGTGLGMSISYDIVQGHRGEIRVDTVPGEFTELCVSLPKTASEA